MSGSPGPAHQSSTLAVVQMRSVLGDKRHNLERSVEWLEQAAAAGASLAVLPELALSGYAPRTREEAVSLAESIDGPAVQAWSSVAAQTGLSIVAGFPERDGDHCYNSAVALSPDGIRGVYRKAHLFEREAEVFDFGRTGFPVVDLPLGRVGLLICYDLRFPESVRTIAIRGAEVVAVPTAWVTLSGRRHDKRGVCMQAYCAMALASMNRLFFACASSVGEFRETEFLGNSLITDVSGWPVVGPADSSEERLLLAEIDPAAARDKHLTPRNHLFRDRRPDLYELEEPEEGRGRSGARAAIQGTASGDS